MFEYRHHAALCRIYPAPGSEHGALEVSLQGPLTAPAFIEFRGFVSEKCQDAPACVLRMDQAADVLFSPPSVSPSTKPPAIRNLAVAIVFRPDQRLFWTLYAESLVFLGIRRALFDSRTLNVARRWADQCAALHRQREPVPQG